MQKEIWNGLLIFATASEAGSFTAASRSRWLLERPPGCRDGDASLQTAETS